MRPQAQINAAMCALMREVRLLLSPAQSTAREHIAESRQERAKAALRQWRKAGRMRSEEHTSELQSLMRISYAVFCLKKKTKTKSINSYRTLLNSHTRRHDHSVNKNHNTTDNNR